LGTQYYLDLPVTVKPGPQNLAKTRRLQGSSLRSSSQYTDDNEGEWRKVSKQTRVPTQWMSTAVSLCWPPRRTILAKRHVVGLMDDERAALGGQEAGPLTLRQRYRVQILLRADAGETDEEIADEVGVSPSTVAKVPRRFAAGGLDAVLIDWPRPGPSPPSAARPRRSSSPPSAAPSPGKGHLDRPHARQPPGRAPGGRGHLGGHDPPGPQKSDLKPWQKKSWCPPKAVDGEFIHRMEDVLELFTEPHDPYRPVVWFDEASKELRGDVAEPVPPAPGSLAKQDDESTRHGTDNLFVIVEPLAGRRHVTLTDRRTIPDFAAQMKQLCDEMYPEAEVIREELV